MVQRTCEVTKSTGTVCGKTFNSKQGLYHHKKSHLPYSDRPHVCEVEGCGKRFFEKSKLRRHNLKHSNDPDDQAKIQEMKEDRKKRTVAEKAEKKHLKALSVSDKILVELIEKTIDDIQAGYEKTSKNLDAEDILMMAFWTGTRKDGDMRDAQEEVFAKLREVLVAAGYDPTSLSVTIRLLYDPRGGKGKARRVVRVTQEAMNHIIKHQRYNYSEIAEIMEISRGAAVRLTYTYSETIAKDADTTWEKLIAAGEEYDRVLLKQKLA